MNKYEKNYDYEKAMKLLSTLFDNQYSKSYIENYKNKIYKKALKHFKKGELKEAKKIFEAIIQYKNCLDMLKKCIDEINYQKALQYISKDQYEEALKLLNSIAKYKDSQDYINICKNHKTLLNKYKNAINLMENNKYEESLEIFKDIIEYKNSRNLAKECEIELSKIKKELSKEEVQLLIMDKLVESFKNFSFNKLKKEIKEYDLSNCNKEIISFLDTEIKQLNLTKIPLIELENLKEIIINFNKEALTIKLDNKIKETAINYYENNLTKNAILLFELISKDKSVDKYINEISEKLLTVSENLIKDKKYEQALKKLEIIKDYKNAKELIKSCTDTIKCIDL